MGKVGRTEEPVKRCVNWMAAAALHVDKILTVSPTYAWELMNLPEMGVNLDDIFLEQGVVGIVNGIKTAISPDDAGFAKKSKDDIDLRCKGRRHEEGRAESLYSKDIRTSSFSSDTSLHLHRSHGPAEGIRLPSGGFDSSAGDSGPASHFSWYRSRRLGGKHKGAGQETPWQDPRCRLVRT